MLVAREHIRHLRILRRADELPVQGWAEREREVGRVMASVYFGERFRDERTAAMGCWLDRRLREQWRTKEEEFERLRASATFDPAARFRLAGKEKVEAKAATRWHAAVVEASDEALELAARIGEHCDEELERITWRGRPPPPALMPSTTS